MEEAKYKTGVVENLYFNTKGEIQKIEMNCNAVIVHLFKSYDDEGNERYSPKITIACVDDDMKEPLYALARELLKKPD